MFNNEVLDVVIGLVFVYLLYSLLGTLVQEMIATQVGLRGHILRSGIRRMLDDGSGNRNMSDSFYAHPLIRYLGEKSIAGKDKKPAYITKETFSKVVTDLLRGEVQVSESIKNKIADSISNGQIKMLPKTRQGIDEENVHSIIAPETLRYFRSLWADSQGDVEKFKRNIEFWFDEMMDRVTGWYKKWTQVILLGVGLVIAISFNVDTLKLVGKLEKDPKLREQLIARADAFAKANAGLKTDIVERKDKINSMFLSPDRALDSILKKQYLDSVEAFYAKKQAFADSLYDKTVRLVSTDISNTSKLLALGWSKDSDNWSGWSIIGWLLTAIAISLGAPFWFDTLNKVMKLRSSVPGKAIPEQKAVAEVRKVAQFDAAKN